MKRAKLLALLLCTGMLLLLFAGVSQAALTLKFAHNGNTIPDDAQNVGCAMFKKIVEEGSKGEIVVQLYPAAQLGDARTIVEGVQMGTIEMGDVENGPMGRFLPEAMLWDLPYIFRDIDHAHAVLDGPIGQAIQKKYQEKNIIHLAYNDGGFRYFTNNKRPIKTMSDIKDLKIRVMESEVMISTINAFGSSAIPMAFGELYSALQQGVVDGQENPLNLIFSQRFYEVQKYLSMSQHFYYPRQYIVSPAFWKKLSPAQQELITRASKEGCAAQRKRIAVQEDEMKVELLKLGMQAIETADFDKEPFAKVAREQVYPKFYAKIGGTEQAGKALIDQVINTK